MLRDEGQDQDWLVGSIVADRYLVERRLGEGGMGIVYLAEHRRMHRKCALKVMRPEAMAIPDAVSRFAREAENSSRVAHPNVAMVFDCSDAGDDLMFIAMEYIEGERLADLLGREGRLAPLRAARILEQVAAALRAAHELGIVHRDLKPDNIMLRASSSGNDEVKVVDFGIARAATQESQRLTSTGVVVGTPAFMSPEQLAGETTDARSDQYSLALVAYLMLTGMLPYPKAKPNDLSARLLHPPARLTELVTDVEWPDALQATLDRALSIDPQDRYELIQHFAVAVVGTIESWQRTGGAGGTGGTGVPERHFRVTPRTIRGSVVTAALVGILGVSVFRWSSSDGNGATGRDSGRVERVSADTANTAPIKTVHEPAREVSAQASRPLATASPPGEGPRGRRAGSGTATDSVAESTALSQGPEPGALQAAVVLDVAPTTLDVPERPPDHGFVRIGATGDPSMLYVNRELRGTVSRLQDVRVPLGAILVTLRAEGCQDWDTTVSIAPGDTVRIGRRRPRC